MGDGINLPGPCLVPLTETPVYTRVARVCCESRATHIWHFGRNGISERSFKEVELELAR